MEARAAAGEVFCDTQTTWLCNDDWAVVHGGDGSNSEYTSFFWVNYFVFCYLRAIFGELNQECQGVS